LIVKSTNAFRRYLPYLLCINLWWCSKITKSSSSMQVNEIVLIKYRLKQTIKLTVPHSGDTAVVFIYTTSCAVLSECDDH